jgi:hypothetical protein
LFHALISLFPTEIVENSKSFQGQIQTLNRSLGRENKKS